jgi:hypothetical protein
VGIFACPTLVLLDGRKGALINMHMLSKGHLLLEWPSYLCDIQFEVSQLDFSNIHTSAWHDWTGFVIWHAPTKFLRMAIPFVILHGGLASV